jgi:hypothetical protein
MMCRSRSRSNGWKNVPMYQILSRSGVRYNSGRCAWGPYETPVLTYQGSCQRKPWQVFALAREKMYNKDMATGTIAGLCSTGVEVISRSAQGVEKNVSCRCGEFGSWRLRSHRYQGQTSGPESILVPLSPVKRAPARSTIAGNVTHWRIHFPGGIGGYLNPISHEKDTYLGGYRNKYVLQMSTWTERVGRMMSARHG